MLSLMLQHSWAPTTPVSSAAADPKPWAAVHPRIAPVVRSRRAWSLDLSTPIAAAHFTLLKGSIAASPRVSLAPLRSALPLPHHRLAASSESKVGAIILLTKDKHDTNPTSIRVN
jgi:hypothetical protein